MRILYVDDNEQNRYLLDSMLRAYGHEVVSACDGVEAIDELEKGSFDLIISDILMPRMDGFQLCREVKQRIDGARIPFIFYTASYTERADEELGLRLGASRFVIKPVEPDTLLSIIQDVTQLPAAQPPRPAAHQAQSADSARMAPNGESVYLKSYNERLVHKLEQKVEQLEAVSAELSRANAELSAKFQQRVALLEINNALAASLSRESLFRIIPASLRIVLDSDWIALTLFDGLLNPAGSDAGTHDSGGAALGDPLQNAVQSLTPGGLFGERQFLLKTDLAEELSYPHEAEWRARGVRSYISLPLTLKGRIIGALTTASRRIRRYSEDDAAFLVQVCCQVVLAIGNMLAYEEISDLKSRLEQENVQLREVIRSEHEFSGMIGESAAMRKVRACVETVAPTDATVLILGETGTGKELVAEAVHHLSQLSGQPMVTINCAALPAGLIESELFGHERGAFTGAIRSKPGRFELADHGTVFLDEIGDLPGELQAKLLRVLQEGEFERIGGTRTLKAKVRVIAATNRDLGEAVRSGAFRADLYYRLNVFPIRVPPLRERREDIPLLVQFFLEKCARKLGKPLTHVAPEAMARLIEHDWPGNVRELLHVVERASILSGGPAVHVDSTMISDRPHAEPGKTSPRLDDMERSHILEVLQRTRWVIEGDSGAALLLGLHPNTLRYRLRKLGIRRPV